MKIVFRVDASATMGTGHVMRCLTLADALAAQGADCHFISRENTGNLIDLVLQRGFKVYVLPFDSDWIVPASSTPAHAAWLGVDWRTDAELTKVGVGKTAADWLITDHYALDSRWEKALKPYCRKLMVIDDLADRSHVCDLLLDQNWHAEQTSHRYDSLIKPETVLLLGPEYALLKEEYSQMRSMARRRDGLVRKVLVFMGGSDPSNQTAKVLQALMAEDLSPLEVDVVIGTNHPDASGVATLVTLRPSTVLHQNLPSLAGLMASADLMICAGGATTWERMCLGLPSLVISIANNQTATQQALMAAGHSKFLGEMDKVPTEAIIDNVRWAMNHPKQMVMQSHLNQALVDGAGANRVAKRMNDLTSNASTTSN